MIRASYKVAQKNDGCDGNLGLYILIYQCNSLSGWTSTTTQILSSIIRLALPKTLEASIFMLIFKQMMKLHQCSKCFEYLYIQYSTVYNHDYGLEYIIFRLH